MVQANSACRHAHAKGLFLCEMSVLKGSLAVKTQVRARDLAGLDEQTNDATGLCSLQEQQIKSHGGELSVCDGVQGKAKGKKEVEVVSIEEDEEVCKFGSVSCLSFSTLLRCQCPQS